MTATTTEKTRFRYEFDGDATTMPDAWVDVIFTEAEEEYEGYDRRVIVAAAYVIAVRQLYNRAAKKVDYQQNSAQEKLSQLAKAFDQMRKNYEARLAEVISATSGSSVRVLRGKVKPTRRQEYPDS